MKHHRLCYQPHYSVKAALDTDTQIRVAMEEEEAASSTPQYRSPDPFEVIEIPITRLPNQFSFVLLLKIFLGKGGQRVKQLGQLFQCRSYCDMSNPRAMTIKVWAATDALLSRAVAEVRKTVDEILLQAPEHLKIIDDRKKEIAMRKQLYADAKAEKAAKAARKAAAPGFDQLCDRALAATTFFEFDEILDEDGRFDEVEPAVRAKWYRTVKDMLLKAEERARIIAADIEIQKRLAAEAAAAEAAEAAKAAKKAAAAAAPGFDQLSDRARAATTFSEFNQILDDDGRYGGAGPANRAKWYRQLRPRESTSSGQ